MIHRYTGAIKKSEKFLKDLLMALVLVEDQTLLDLALELGVGMASIGAYHPRQG